MNHFGVNIESMLYDIRKKEIVHSYFYNGDNKPYHEAYYFAIANDMFPFFEFESLDRDSNKIYDGYYKINNDKMEEVIQYFDKDFMAKNYKTFYEYEDILDVKKITGKSPLKNDYYREELIDILRYCFLNHVYDEGFYNQLISQGNAPGEANGIKNDFDPSEIKFY